MDVTAQFFPDPVAADAVKRSRTFHAADSQPELETTINEQSSQSTSSCKKEPFNWVKLVWQPMPRECDYCGETF